MPGLAVIQTTTCAIVLGTNSSPKRTSWVRFLAHMLTPAPRDCGIEPSKLKCEGATPSVGTGLIALVAGITHKVLACNLSLKRIKVSYGTRCRTIQNGTPTLAKLGVSGIVWGDAWLSSTLRQETRYRYGPVTARAS